MVYIPPAIRRSSILFLKHISDEWEVQPTTKYCALMFYNDRLLCHLESYTEEGCGRALRTSFLDLYPLSLSDLKLLCIVSLWISVKVQEGHCPRAMRVVQLAQLHIVERQFTADDLIEAETMFLKVIEFDVRIRPCPYFDLERLHLKLRDIADTIQERLSLQLCENILDIVYEWRWERVELMNASNAVLAAAVLVAGCHICAAEQMLQRPGFQLRTWLSAVVMAEEAEIFAVCNRIMLLVAMCSEVAVEAGGFKLIRSKIF